jgi:hypothetical protein
MCPRCVGGGKQSDLAYERPRFRLLRMAADSLPIGLSADAASLLTSIVNLAVANRARLEAGVSTMSMVEAEQLRLVDARSMDSVSRLGGVGVALKFTPEAGIMLVSLLKDSPADQHAEARKVR